MIFDIVCTSTPSETISCGVDKTIVRYDWKGKSVMNKWALHSKSVDKLAYGEKSKLVFSGSRDTTIRMWTTANKVELACLKGHMLPVAGLVVNPDNTKLCSGGRDYSVRWWDIERREQLKMNTEPRNVVTCMQWVPNEETVLQGSEDLELRVWDARTYSVVQRLAFDNHFALSCDVSADSMYFVTSHMGFDSDGCMVKLWDRRKQGLLQEFLGHTQAVYDCCFLPANAQGKIRIASCSKDQSIKIWEQSEASTGDAACLSTTTLKKSPCEIRCLAVSSLQHQGPAVLYSGSGDGFINVWHVKSNGKLDCVAQSKRPAAGI